MTVAEEPTLGEIGRGVQELKAELRAMRGELVRSDVYAANRMADELRVRALEQDLTQMAADRQAMRRLVLGAVVTSVGALIVQAAATVMSHIH